MAKTNLKTKAQPDVTPEKVRIEYMELGELKRWPRNPKAHDEQAISDSIRTSGFIDPLVVDEKSGRMVAGHGRLSAVEKMWEAGEKAPEGIMVKAGKWYLPVLRGKSFKDERAAEKYLLAANRTVELGGWDNKDLARILSKYKDDTSLIGTGFTSAEVVKFLALAKGDKIGLNTDERKEVFDNATIKQIVLYFPSAQFEKVIERLNKIMEEREDLNSHSAVFVEMLDRWDGAAVKVARKKKTK